jgi:glycosyltransferase involved in cell wall biosynthesis
MLTTWHVPLDDRIYYKEILSLIKKYPSISIVAPRDSSDQSFDHPDIKFFPLKMKKTTLSRFFVLPQAIKIVLKIRPDVCHFHDFEFLFALPLLRLFSRTKFIYDAHEVFPDMVRESRKKSRLIFPLFSKMVDISERWLARLAHYVIATDENIAIRFRVIRQKVSVIYNYPRLSLFVQDKQKTARLEKHYKNRLPIIYIGGMSEDKGLFQMLKAMQIIRTKRPEVLLLLIGFVKKKYRKRLNDELIKEGMQEIVDYLGWIPHTDIVNYIHISKIGLIANLPTEKWKKNIPIKQFEYMACGIPVLGSDLPPIAPYIKASGCGKVFDPTSADALAKSIQEILEDEENWKNMSENGKMAVQKSWNWSQMEKKLFSIYERVLGIE